MTSTFHIPTKLIFGSEAIEGLGAEINAKGIKKVLLVFGSGSVKRNGVYTRVIKTLTSCSIASVELWGVQPNPLITKVREGVAICKDPTQGVEGVVAVGGGSVIDSCKAICAGAKLEVDVWEVFHRRAQPPAHGLPLFTVLTLSATSSENDAGAVISDHDAHIKLGAHFEAPVASAIDPSVQLSLPYRQVMCGAMDSLSHLLESYFSLPNKNITTRQLNLAFQKSLIKAMERIKANINDADARFNFVWAISMVLSGLPSFQLSGDWNVHYIEHALSAFDDKIAHGEGLAIITRAYYPYLYKRGIAKEMFEEWAETIFGEKNVDAAFAKLNQLLDFWGAPKTLQDVKVTRADIKKIVEIERYHAAHGVISPLLPLKPEDTQAILEIASGVTH